MPCCYNNYMTLLIMVVESMIKITIFKNAAANFQGYSCQAEIEVDKRNENSVDFRVCVDHGKYHGVKATVCYHNCNQ